MLFDLYLFRNFFLVFLSVNLVSVLLVSLYGLLEFILGFKEKSINVALQYFFNLLPLGFYYLSFITSGISSVVFLKRIVEKKIDLTVQSFGISPLRFSLSVLLFFLFLSSIFLLGNQYLFPKLLGNLWYIEKHYKKKQRIAGVIKDFWFLKEGEYRTYYYIGSLNLSDGVLIDSVAIKVERRSLTPVEEIKVFTGLWKGDEIIVYSGEVYNLIKGERKILSFERVRIGIHLKEVELFSTKIDFLTLKDLFILYAKSKAVGLNADTYGGELTFRVLFSFLPSFVSLLAFYLFFRWRDIRKVSGGMVIGLFLLWGIVLSPKLITQKANQPLYFSLLPVGILVILSLKGIHNLRKGFRV
ncbi:LptF/LptG family permease [Aquifex pyrophilus]